MSSEKYAFATPATEVQGEWCGGQKGLTKKEYVSVEVLKSLISSGLYSRSDIGVYQADLTELSCKIANRIVGEWDNKIFENL